MLMHYKVGAQMVFDIEAPSPKELFKKIATVQEIFDTDKVCGACQSTRVRFKHRTVDDYEFFEISCEDCTARLQFGQLKKGGGLFVKRRDDDGHELPNGGWEVYVPRKQNTRSEPTGHHRDVRQPGDETLPHPGRYGHDARTDKIDDSDLPF